MIKIDTKNTWIFILSKPNFIKCFNINPLEFSLLKRVQGDSPTVSGR